MKVKKCCKCGADKSVNDFYVSKGNVWGKCKDCFREEQRERGKHRNYRNSDAPYVKVSILEDYMRSLRELE